MKTPTCVHASREEPCWGAVRPHFVHTCAGHYYVEMGGRYVAMGERHAFESKIAAMREPSLRDLLDRGAEVSAALDALLAEDAADNALCDARAGEETVTLEEVLLSDGTIELVDPESLVRLPYLGADLPVTDSLDADCDECGCCGQKGDCDPDCDAVVFGPNPVTGE